MEPMYAIIATGGKQYRVSEGSVISVEKLDALEGAEVTFDDVRLVVDEEHGISVNPTAKVTGRVVAHGKEKKVLVMKYKSKARYRRKNGHRQPFTKVTIEHIVVA
jgi:large subunit ribosomal protein L21